MFSPEQHYNVLRVQEKTENAASLFVVLQYVDKAGQRRSPPLLEPAPRSRRTSPLVGDFFLRIRLSKLKSKAIDVDEYMASHPINFMGARKPPEGRMHEKNLLKTQVVTSQKFVISVPKIRNPHL